MTEQAELRPLEWLLHEIAEAKQFAINHSYALTGGWVMATLNNIEDCAEKVGKPDPALASVLQQVREALVAFSDAVLVDPDMSGKALFKGYNQSQLNRARPLCDQALTLLDEYMKGELG